MLPSSSCRFTTPVLKAIFIAAMVRPLASMIGAIVLTHRRRVGNRRQDIGVQVARTPAGTLGVGKAGLGQGVEL
jgi:NADH-quinone oxidoreductase subunit J